MLLTDLNPKVLLDVFSYLNLGDSISLAETCIRLREVAEIKYKQYKTFDLVAMSYLIERDARIDIRKVLSHVGPHISTLRAELHQYRNDLDLSKPIQKYCKNVKSLQVYETYDSVYSMWIQKLKLESLALERMRNLNGKLGHCITTLKELRIDDIFYNFGDERIVTDSYYILEQNPNIEALRIGLTRQFNYEIFAKLHKLRYLGIDVEHTTDLTKLIPYLRMNELTEVEIADWHHDNQYIDGLNEFLKFLAKNTRLEKLIIRMRKNWIVESTLSTLDVFELTSLYVTAPYGNYQRIETTIAHVQPNLSHLHLGIRDQTLERIIFLIKNLMKLKTFHFMMESTIINQLLDQATVRGILQTFDNRPNLQLHIRCFSQQHEIIVVSLFFNACNHKISKKRSSLNGESLPSCCSNF